MTVAERITSKLNMDSVAPYVDQALHDDELRSRARKAYSSGQDVYGKLRKEPDIVSALARLASDERLQRDARATVTELHRAARRLGGSRDTRARRALRALAVASAVGVVVVVAARRNAQS